MGLNEVLGKDACTGSSGKDLQGVRVFASFLRSTIWTTPRTVTLEALTHIRLPEDAHPALPARRGFPRSGSRPP